MMLTQFEKFNPAAGAAMSGVGCIFMVSTSFCILLFENQFEVQILKNDKKCQRDMLGLLESLVNLMKPTEQLKKKQRTDHKASSRHTETYF